MSRVVLRRARVTDHAPVVYRWDLDKTYLKSDFETWRELMRIPFEKAEDKIAAPGVAALIRALRETASRRGTRLRVYFISASPPQIGRAIRQKLELDGIQYDGIVFKDQLQHIMRGKFRHLREQVGYKLTELLKERCDDPPEANEYLFGDDWESDPLIYSLYADVVAGRVSRDELAELLDVLRVDPPLAAEATRLAGEVATAEAVSRIFINLERRTPLARFAAYGPRLVPTFNYLQTAVCLFEAGVLDEAGVAQVGRSLFEQSSYTRERITNSLADVGRRGLVAAATVWTVREVLQREDVLPRPAVTWPGRLRGWWRRIGARLRGRRLIEGQTWVDYRALIGEQKAVESNAS